MVVNLTGDGDTFSFQTLLGQRLGSADSRVRNFQGRYRGHSTAIPNMEVIFFFPGMFFWGLHHGN